MDRLKIYTVAITGASGVIYGVRLIQELLKSGYKVHLIITDAGWQVLEQELKWNITNKEKLITEHFLSYGTNLEHHKIKDFTAPIASGSYRSNGMIVIPCSMGTLSGIANGSSGNLLERTADVMLKEGKRLIIVPRETPLNNIHLENMLTLSRAGARVIPAMPGFYHNPKTLDDIVNHLVGKVLDSLDIPHNLFARWGE